MPELPEFRRYEADSGMVEYEILSTSKKRTCYYSVFLLNGVGISCECRFKEFNSTCKHIEFAEAHEAELQTHRKPAEVPLARDLAPLNDRNKGFRLLR